MFESPMFTSQSLPIFLSLGAAASFGVSVVVAQAGLREVNARLGALLSIGATAGFFWLLFPLIHPETPWGNIPLPQFIGLFIVVGLFTPGISLYLAFEANRRLGPTVSGTIASTAPLFATISAIVVLGEQPTPAIALGTLCIVAGVMVLAWRGARDRTWPLWAVLLPLGAAFLRGGIHMGTKYGLGIANAPFTAAMITFTAGVVMVALYSRGSRTALKPGGLRRAIKWLLLTGILNGIGVFCLNSALARGQVVVVSPIVATFPIFTFFLSLALRYDRFGARVLCGVVLVVGGVVAITAL